MSTKVPYDEKNDNERINYWKNLLVGKKIKNLIFKNNKSSHLEKGIRKYYPGFIGFILEDSVYGEIPIYILPGAFGDSFGTFMVYFNETGTPIFCPEEG